MEENKLVALVPGKYIRKVLHKETLERFNGKDPFRVSKRPIWDQEMLIGFVVANRSPLQMEMQKVMEQLKAGGIIDQLMVRYTYSWRPGINDLEELQPLGLLHLSLGLIAYLLGAILAIFAFIHEMVGSKTKKRRNLFSNSTWLDELMQKYNG